MSTYVFPGQGSQSLGMGGDLFDRFSDLTARASSILGYSIKELCLNDPYEQLTLTQYSQPAIFTVNAFSYFNKRNESGAKPLFVAGHSLGEYNALLAADVFDFETGLKLVKKRGELMSKAEDGAMTAVIGLSEDMIKQNLIKNFLNEVSIANYNTNTQIVISGKKQEIEAAQTILEKAGASLIIPLKVSGAFHSPLMKAAQIAFENFLQETSLSIPTIPVIANISARPYPQCTQHISNYLSQQIIQPVFWTQTIHYLLEQGETEFEEIGPGNILTGLIRRIRSGQ